MLVWAKIHLSKRPIREQSHRTRPKLIVRLRIVIDTKTKLVMPFSILTVVPCDKFQCIAYNFKWTSVPDLNHIQLLVIGRTAIYPHQCSTQYQLYPSDLRGVSHNLASYASHNLMTLSATFTKWRITKVTKYPIMIDLNYAPCTERADSDTHQTMQTEPLGLTERARWDIVWPLRV